MDTEIISIIRDLGFPIFICLWLIFRTEKIIQKNTDAIRNIGKIIYKCKIKK